MLLKIEVLIYLLCTCFAAVKVFRVKKNDKEANAFLMLFLSIYFLMVVQSFVSGVFNWLHIPIRLITLGLINLVIGLVLCFIERREGKQKYSSLMKTDVIAFCVNILLTLLVMYKFFGLNLEVTFVSVDGSAHFAFAKNIFDSYSISTNMYFEALNDAIWMMVLHPFMSSVVGLTKAFVLSQVVSFFIGVQVFYILCRSYSDEWKDSILAEVVTIFYALGYFLYAVIYGFAYFAQSMNLIIVIMIVIKLYTEKKLDKISTICYLNFSLFSVFVCYSLFVPVVFVAVFATIWFKQREENGSFISLSVMKEEVMIFALPCIFGLLYTFSNVKELGDGGGITNEGGCYFDLYSNFLKYLPLIIAGLMIVWSKKKFDIVITMSVISSCFWFVLIVMNLKDKASLYYVSKVYNLFWVCACLLIAVCLWEIRRKYMQLLIGGGIMLLLSGVLLFTPIAQKVIDDNPGYVTVYESASAIFPHVYWFNRIQIGAYHYLQDDKIEFFENAAETYSDGDNNVLLVGDTFEQVWYRAIAGDGVTVDKLNVDFATDLTPDIEYVVMMNSDEATSILDDSEELFDIVYQDSNGYILNVK